MIKNLFISMILFISFSASSSVEVEFRDFSLSRFARTISLYTEKPVVVDISKHKDIKVDFSVVIDESALVPFLRDYLLSLDLYLFDRGDFYYISDKQYSDLENENKQVLIRAIVFESSLDNMTQVGIDMERLSRFTVSSALSPLEAGLSLSLFPSADFGAILSAIESDAETSILSAPVILTRHNKNGRIMVGQNVPTVSSRKSSEEGQTETQSVERIDLGVSLEVVPQVLTSGDIALKIKNTASSINNSVSASDLVFNTRELETELVMSSGSTVYLGGLISDSSTTKVSGIPLVSDIPYLGRLFSSERKETKKTQLGIYLFVQVI